MHLITLCMGGLLGSALAMPHYDNGHHYKKKPQHYSPTGTAPAPTAGPYSRNSTAGPTSLFHHSSGDGYEGRHDDGDVTVDVYVTKTSGAEEVAAAEATPTSPAAEDKHKVASGECGPKTVTVTSNSVTTVTVGGGSSDSAASPEPTKGAVSLVSSPLLSPHSTLTPSETSKEGGSPPVSSSALPTANPDDSIARPVPQAPSSSASAPAPSQSSTDTTDTTGSGTTGSSKPAAGLRSKRGIISAGDNSKALPAAVGNTKIAWLGNWYSGPPGGLPESVTFVPQMYGKGSEKNGEWENNAKKAIAAGDKIFFSFGEPGTPNKDRYMTPEEGADFFRKQMEPYAKQGVTIGAPGTLQNKQDFDWLEKFLAACNDCSIGFLQQHWFDKAAPTARQIEAFKGTVNDALKIANGKYPVWIENFQAQGSAEDQKAFLKEVIPWLESNEQVQGYGYVPGDKDSAGMMDGDKLNDLGSYYANF